MNKLLLRKLWEDKKDLGLIWGLVLIAIPIVFFITKSSDSIRIFVISQIIVYKMNKNLWGKVLRIPENFYLIPLKQKELREIIFKELCLSCVTETGLLLLLLVSSFWIESIIAHFYGSVLYETEKLLEFNWWRSVILTLNIFSVVHIMYYHDYLKRTKEGVAELLVIAAAAKWIFCIITLSLGKEITLAGVLFYLLFAIPLFSLDIYYPVKYLRKMIDFYTDFERSRGIG